MQYLYYIHYCAKTIVFYANSRHNHDLDHSAEKKDLAEIKFGTSFSAKNKSCDHSGQARLEATSS